MTMAANAYKTQSFASDRAIAEIIIAGFTGQLKGWWDYHLTDQEQLDILSSIQVNSEGEPILNELGETIQDAVSALILTISLHFIGDPSHLKDKNAELLSNLKCKKLSHFQNYKTTFLTRLMLREDSNQDFWKEKFLAGLPYFLGEKVRNHIKNQYGNPIPYSKLTFGQLVSIIQKEGLQICHDLKLQRTLKYEMHKTKHELGSFCKQFDYGIEKKYNPYKKYRNKAPIDKTHNKKSFRDLTCYNCGKKGHTSKFCMFNKKLNELNLEEEIVNKIQELCIHLNSSDSEKSISVLTKEQSSLLELINNIEDNSTKEKFLKKLIKSMDETEEIKESFPKINRQTYDLTKILGKNKQSGERISIEDLQREIKIIKSEVKDLKGQLQKDAKRIKFLEEQLISESSSSSNEEKEDEDDQDNIEQLIQEITSRKYLIKLKIKLSENFIIDTIALFDTGADLNCIKSSLVPRRFWNKTKEKLSTANRTKLNILGKTEALIVNQDLEIKTVFLLSQQISHMEILSIVVCINKFQSDLLNQKFLVRIDCKSAKDVLQKDVKNLASKQIFARWQALLSIFDFDIEYIKGSKNNIPDFLTREFLQKNGKKEE
ncbi:hypothetical protein MANES_10G066150v8 [Manihot esculenta]|uniref:Uncharacterized protein n=1 Tax=Manihot esculenta TaxID=3983 RepID=A0ACB7GYT7_MANES|nr:hypothetical protein MANES_10G066150v8 [Manihot esculenta]